MRNERRGIDREEIVYNGKETYSTLWDTFNSTLGNVDSPENEDSTLNCLSQTTVLHPNPRRSRLRSLGVDEAPLKLFATLSTPVPPSNGAKTVLKVRDKDDIVVLNSNRSSK